MKVYYTKFSPAAIAMCDDSVNVMTDEGKQSLSTLFNHFK